MLSTSFIQYKSVQWAKWVDQSYNITKRGGSRHQPTLVAMAEQLTRKDLRPKGPLVQTVKTSSFRDEDVCSNQARTTSMCP